MDETVREFMKGDVRKKETILTIKNENFTTGPVSYSMCPLHHHAKVGKDGGKKLAEICYIIYDHMLKWQSRL